MAGFLRFESVPSPGLLFVITSGALLFAIVLYGSYNLFVHPLRNFPGPKLWAAYRIPYAICAWRGEIPYKVLEFHQKYGPVVRIAPNELAFSDSRAFPDLQGLLPDRTQNQKDVYAYAIDEISRDIIHADDATHARLRKMYAPAFTPAAVENLEGLLLKHANLLVSTLKQGIKQNPVQDINKFMNFVVFDFTGDLVFDESFHCLERGGKNHFFCSLILDGVKVGCRIVQLERYGIFSMVKPFMPKSAFKPRDDMYEYVTELVDRRSERGYIPGKVDVFNYSLLNKDERDRLNRDELVQNGVIFVAAGSDTTAASLAGTIWQLCTHREIMQKVVSEVRSAFKADDQITIKTVNDLPYMLAVLRETLRTFPPVPNGFARVIRPDNGLLVAGHYVPKGMTCTVNHYAAFRYERNFVRPNEFLPERWLGDAPSEFANDSHDALQPFHVGPRGCIGKHLAYAEMRVVLAKMLWHFDIELVDSNIDWMRNLGAWVVWDRIPLLVRLKPTQK